MDDLSGGPSMADSPDDGLS